MALGLEDCLLLETGSVMARLISHPHRAHISAGNPARTTREAHGPLYLKVGGHTAAIPEEMSLWQAICCSPPELRWLTQTEFRLLSSTVLKVLEVANKPYALRVTLKLSPVATDEFTTNQLKRTAVFRADWFLGRRIGQSEHDMEVWKEVWAEYRVPDFASLEHFRNSSLGRHLWLGSSLTSVGAQDIAADGLEDVVELAEGGESPDDADADDGDGDEEIVELAEPFIEELVRAGVLGPYDEWYLRERARGTKLARMARSPKTIKMFRRLEIPVSYEIGLLARIRDHLSRSRSPSR